MAPVVPVRPRASPPELAAEAQRGLSLVTGLDPTGWGCWIPAEALDYC